MSAELFVELFHEELPASMAEPTLAALRDGLIAALEGVDFGEVTGFHTPRRTAVWVREVALARPVIERLVTGPPAERAFVDGAPTQVAIGFAKGRGVEVSALEVVDGPKGPVVALRVQEGGEPTRDTLAAALPGIVLGIPFAKSMEWGRGGMRFGRPLHRVNALFGGAILDADVGGIRTGATTEGHRLADAPVFGFTSCEAWLTGLRERFVEPDIAVREGRVRSELLAALSDLGADPLVDEELLVQVARLVEWPVGITGTFDASLLELPPKLLVESMKVHQRYFPVFRDGELTHRFVVISNNPFGEPGLIAEGNARVLRARFHDARFFLQEDRKRSLESHGQKLGNMRWIRGLGTMADKQARVSELAAQLASVFEADIDLVRRAGALCKADLATQMVGEFPSLQGHMGRVYASHDGEPEGVAIAIEEHYRPAFAEDDPADTPEGAAVAVADRLDTLVGCFGIGMQPKGGDPQGLRRAALGVVNTLLAHGIRVGLGGLFGRAVRVFDEQVHSVAEADRGRFDRWTAEITKHPSDHAAAISDELVAFALARLKAAEVADGASGDLVDAVFEAAGPVADVVSLHGKVDALKALAGTDAFLPILQTFKRVLNITRGEHAPAPEASALSHDAERALYAAITATRGRVDSALAQGDYELALERMVALQAPVDAFFEAVFVDDADPSVRAVRVGLLREVATMFLQIADFSRISTR